MLLLTRENPLEKELNTMKNFSNGIRQYFPLQSTTPMMHTRRTLRWYPSSTRRTPYLNLEGKSSPTINIVSKLKALFSSSGK